MPVLDISCVHGDHKTHPVAVVYLEVAEQTFVIPVGVVDSLSYPAILRRNVPILQELVQACKLVNVFTRSQKQAQMLLEEGNRGVQNEEVPQSSKQLILGGEGQSVGEDEARKSRRQKRLEKMAGTIRKGLDHQEPGVQGTDQTYCNMLCWIF